MLRILLVSDTHGDLDCLNRLAEEKNADLIIHAGDFGFYDEKSLNRLSVRELKLRIVHSPYGDEISRLSSKEEMRKFIREFGLLGDFPEYLNGNKKFTVPIYAVWGNHEDEVVLQELRNGQKVANLHLLDEERQYTISDFQGYPFFLYGLGGNFVLNEKAFSTTFQGVEGKVQATFHQLGTLLHKVKQPGIPSLFVSHVSPGKEPVLARLLAHNQPNFWISGHMGLPYPCVWNQFAIRDGADVERWMSDLSFFSDNRKMSSEAQYICKLLQKPMRNEHRWFYHTWNVNLPDIGDGHALIVFQEGKFSLETYGGKSD
ncbi:metallophosphoesterase family protein [Simkania sp.]|uniref:metallophosphoesterase family protein n=1 Tax=Simkania sp. TaxID=34094 RepID=UPI003B51C1B7